ncbi:RsmB/NOP family class I SAM-dependent RNA methyltransferase [Acidibrevibacterium fodinaquatile]|uniref:RsmB/NOP family class I SAM-dependent RNA methyltransferase n=1 Tax=Acidibrevibacterium fodinaquatile TaxID=1969806 RepID=UPI000E0D69FB|nr:transcription antitermination factor NusB [Acidibrevibacterium fodinaquatile]
MPETPPPDPTRDSALFLLTETLDRHRTLDAALHALPGGDGRDRAAAHRLAATVLRRLGTLDAVLDAHLRRAPPVTVRHALRLGAAALLFLATPPHAAVSTAVALTRRAGFGAFAGLVNAVLRRVASDGGAALESLDPPRLDTPPWLWASWGEAARAIALGHQNDPPLDLTPLPGVSPLPAGEILPSGSLRLPPGSEVTALPGYREGNFFVQDTAAALPVRLLGPLAGQEVADLCAAPGGKTAQLVLAGARVTAVERAPARLARLAENLARLHLDAELVNADALTWRPGRRFDAVLLDAPCSATGTIRRHPEIPHLRSPRDLDAMIAAQDALLDAACTLLKPGGRLLYAVCSLQPEEGLARIKAALGRLPLRRAPIGADELPFLAEALTEAGDLRTHPGLWAAQGGMDGFFAARLIRL